jgi:ATPase subunit of ABC transporter with duplicated ATPase domains
MAPPGNRASGVGASLVASGITHHVGGRLVLNDVSVAVGRGHRVGIVGPNGVGKTTLLRILAGLERPDRGEVRRSPPSLAVGYLPQEPDLVPGETLMDFLARRTGVASAQLEMDRLARALEADPSLAQAYADSLERFLAMGGDDLRARASAVVGDLTLPVEKLNAPVGALSGGQAARAQLAAILLARFDVFLLDEPTNNLDLDGLDRLERFVSSVPGGVALVSHDRAFLARTVDRVLEIEPSSHRARVFAGGWAAYVAERERADRERREAYERNVAERTRLLGRAREIRTQAVKGATRARRRAPDPDRSLRRKRIEGAENRASGAKAVERQLARLGDLEKPFEPWELRLSFAAARRGGDLVARLEGALVQRGSFVLGPIDLEVRWRDRVAILGPNGSGKTTLLKALTGEVELMEGVRTVGAGTVFGELSQGRELFLGDEAVLETFCHSSGLLPEEARSLLAKFGMGVDAVTRAGSSLSAGERTRAVLALLMARGVNCLILDEPTNHLDLPAIEELERALEAYNGTLLLVTHDRALLQHVLIARSVELDGGHVAY